MQKLWVLLCLFVLLYLSSYHTIGEEIIDPKETIEVRRADFNESFKYLMIHEGFYSNHFIDKGGETYMGIARNLNKSWIGWETIDEYKRHNHIKWNDSIPIEYLNWKVREYYLSIWVDEDFYSIEDQDIANYCIDLRINCTWGSYIIKKTLVEMNYPLIVNNIMDSTTVKYLNCVPKWQFLCKLMENRIDYYTGIVDRQDSQIIFLKHWVRRVKIN